MTIKNILLIAFMATLAGCVTPQRCLDKFGSKEQKIIIHDTVTVVVRAVVPPDSLQGYLSPDSVAGLLAGVIDSIINVSADKKVEIDFSRDKKTGGLRYKAKCNADTVTITKEVPVTVKGICPPSVVVDPDKALHWYERAWRGFQLFSAIVVLIGFTLFVVFVIVKLF